MSPALIHVCTHVPVLSEPSMLLHCARCGGWLTSGGDTYIVTTRANATRGTCSHSDEARADGWCPNCHADLEDDDEDEG